VIRRRQATALPGVVATPRQAAACSGVAFRKKKSLVNVRATDRFTVATVPSEAEGIVENHALVPRVGIDRHKSLAVQRKGADWFKPYLASATLLVPIRIIRH